MPQELGVGAWMFLYYANKDQELPEQQFWEKWSKEQAKELSSQLKLNADSVRAASEATAGATTDAEKLQAIVRFIRQRVKPIENRTAQRRQRPRHAQTGHRDLR